MKETEGEAAGPAAKDGWERKGRQRRVGDTHNNNAWCLRPFSPSDVCRT